jgi:hypothetical protein
MPKMRWPMTIICKQLPTTKGETREDFMDFESKGCRFKSCRARNPFFSRHLPDP